MRALIWKELCENLKWVSLPALVIGSLIALFGMLAPMDEGFLFFLSIVAGIFGAALGFVQIFFEASGDKRSLLLHRPVSHSRIFLSKVVSGAALYLLALGIPFACVVALAATPGHVYEPFSGRTVLPGLADILTGLVCYFAGMLTGPARGTLVRQPVLGFGRRGFLLVLGLDLPEFWQALVAIGIVGGVCGHGGMGEFCRWRGLRPPAALCPRCARRHITDGSLGPECDC